MSVPRIALLVWLALMAAIATWPLGESGIGAGLAALALLPLLLPLPGLYRARRRSFAWAPMTLAPALAIALTESLANPAARWRAAFTLALILAAFAGLLAARHAASPG